MTIAEILAIISGLAQAIPQLATLLSGIKGGSTATAADVLAILNKCGVDRAVFAASIAVAETKGV